MSDSRQYELVYVVSPDVAEDGVAELHTRIEEIAQQLEGSIDKTDNWGRRRLAYEINRHREATYVLELVSGPASMLAELDRRLRVMDELLRHLIVRVDEDLRKAERARVRRQSRQQKRLAAKGVTAGSAADAGPPTAEGDVAPATSTAPAADAAATAEVTTE